MIDKLPSLPTDNLYKFGTIGGLVLFIAGIAGPLVSNSFFDERLEQISKEHDEKWKAEEDRNEATSKQLWAEWDKRSSENQKEYIAILKDGYDLTIENRQRKLAAGGDVSKLGQLEKEHENRRSLIVTRLEYNRIRREGVFEVCKSQAEKNDSTSKSTFKYLTTDFQKRTGWLLRRFESIDRILLIAGCAGGLVFLVSIKRWYYRHQLHQDLLLLLELRKAERELDLPRDFSLDANQTAKNNQGINASIAQNGSQTTPAELPLPDTIATNPAAPTTTVARAQPASE